MTREEYELEVLRSADADGILHPVPLTDWWAQMSVLMGMYIRAEIDKTGDGPMRERTGPYCIAEAGRARLAAHNAGLSGCEPTPDQETHGLSSQSARTHS